jgi:2-oxoisovalerate dehydrogenase E2 component (dihydrolipoyl transacylase)
MGAQTFVLPDLGEGLTEAEIVRWLVAEGDEIKVDQAVVEVETAKSLVEVPSPYAGRVVTLHAPAGTTLDVGKPLITVGSAEGSGNVLIGYGTSGGTVTTRRRRPRAVVHAAAPGRVPLVVSPLVRNLARDNGVDLRTVEPTGRDGIITRADVDRAIRGGVPAVAGERRTPISGFRKAVSAALSRSRAEIPEATVWVDVDATRLWELRAAHPGGPGLLAYLARFTVMALRAYPVFNGRLDTERQEMVEFDQIDLGIAVQGDRGLVVPAVAAAERMTTTELDAEIRRVTAAARDGRVGSVAGTFTLNNYGSFGVDGSAAIINHPQVAILGIGRMIDRPWVVDGALCVRKIAQMSFVFDHRVCDGGTAAGFMRCVADAIEDPASVIARL